MKRNQEKMHLHNLLLPIRLVNNPWHFCSSLFILFTHPLLVKRNLAKNGKNYTTHYAEGIYENHLLTAKLVAMKRNRDEKSQLSILQ